MKLSDPVFAFFQDGDRHVQEPPIEDFNLEPFDILTYANLIVRIHEPVADYQLEYLFDAFHLQPVQRLENFEMLGLNTVAECFLVFDLEIQGGKLKISYCPLIG